MLARLDSNLCKMSKRIEPLLVSFIFISWVVIAVVAMFKIPVSSPGNIQWTLTPVKGDSQ